MQQVFICARGHRWYIDAANADSEKPSACPHCGETNLTTPPQSDARDAADGMFQDLGAHRAGGAEPKLSLAPENTAFQDLNAPKETPQSSPTEGREDNTSFQHLPVRGVDRPLPGKAVAAPPAKGTPERSTAVTARFAGPRREALGRGWPALPGYDIVGEIGHSATSVVFQARESGSQRLVAIKVITAGDYASAKQTAWLRAELEAIARLQHPCVAQIYDVGEHEGRLHIVMEYVDGGNLEQKVRGKPQSATRSAQLMETVARTLSYVHEQNLVHRNLKPGNILLTSEGTPKLTDFSMARATDRSSVLPPAGMIGGDPSYMAPEHLQPDQSAVVLQRSATPASDIYALGAVLFESLTGRPPFLGATPADTVQLALEEDPVSPAQLQLNVSETLQAISLKCLQKRAERRYANARELADDLHAYLVNEPIQARPAGVAERLWKSMARRPFLILSAVVLLSAYLYLAIALIRNRSVLLADVEAAAAAKTAAENQLADTRRVAYLADMGMAQEAWQDGNRDVALAFLEKHRQDDDLRSFEWGYLWRACRSDRLTLSPGVVHALAFSANGRILATAGEAGAGAKRQGEVHLYDAATGTDWARAPAPKAPLLAVAFAPVGRLLATGDAQGDIQVWDSLNGKQRHAFPAHGGPVKALAFAPDGKTLASGANDGVVKLWDSDSARQQGALPGHLGTINGLAYSGDGRLLAAACQGGAEHKAGEIRLWDWAARTQRALLRGHRGPVHCAAFSADGVTLASGGGLPGRAGELKLWDLQSNRLKLDLPGCLDRVLTLAYTPDGSRLAVGGDDGLVTIWNTTGIPVRERVLKGATGPITSVAVAADGDTVASAGGNATVKVWSLAQADGATLLRDAKSPLTMPVNAVAFTKHNKVPVLASVGGEAGHAGEIKVWDAARGVLLGSLDRGLDRSVLAATFSPDGKILATAGEDTTAKLWDWEKGRMLTRLQGHTHWVTCVAFAPQGNVIATGSEDGTIRLWNVETGRESATLKGPVHVPRALAFSPDGTVLASADEDHSVRLWKVPSGKELLKISGHTGSVLAVAFSADGKALATASADLSVRLWNPESGLERRVLRGHTYAVTSVAFTADGKSLASGGRDGTIRLWDLESGQPRGVLRGHTGWVSSITFSPDGKTLASGGFDKTVRLWVSGE